MSGRIIGVAVMFRGVIHSAVAPARHHHVLRELARSTGTQHVGGEAQGFIDESGDYLTREEALMRVQENGQLTKPIIGGVLTSEDLW